MLRKTTKMTALVGVVSLFCALFLVACDQEKACASELTYLPQSVVAKGGGGGGGHGGSGGGGHGGGEGGSGAHGSEGGSGAHDTSGQSHPEQPHPDTAPDAMPGAHDDSSHPGQVTYPGWPGSYPRGVYPQGYSGYYGCHAQPSPTPSR